MDIIPQGVGKSPAEPALTAEPSLDEEVTGRGALLARPVDPTEHYATLQQAFRHFNDALFEGKIPPVIFTMQRKNRMAGFYHAGIFNERGVREHRADEIAINPQSIAEKSDLYVLQIVAHEMAHAWQQHYGKPSRTGYHNHQFAEKMEEIGLMTSADGHPGGARVGQSMSDYLIPGGRFEVAAKELLDQGWAFRWEDRSQYTDLTVRTVQGVKIPGYDVHVMKQEDGEFVLVAAPNGTPPTLPSADASQTIPDPESFTPEVQELLVEAPTANNSLVVYVDGKPARIQKPKPADTGKKVYRHKYSCPSGHQSAWAKPESNLLCGDCQSPMQSIGKV